MSTRTARGSPIPASSVLKLRGTELQQRITELTLQAAGPHGLVGENLDAPLGHNEDEIAPEWMRLAAPTYFNTRKVTIYGGSNEIQRNIIAKQILGLKLASEKPPFAPTLGQHAHGFRSLR